jgi:subtilisin family serine protease
LHELATGRNVRVAVVDSMIDARHPDLAGQFQIRRNFVPDRADAPELHGTGVAGVIAALADNGVGVAGVAPSARLMALRACWQQKASATICNTFGLAEALHFAIEHDAQVINLSLSGPPDLLLGKLIDVGLARGIVVVGAVDPTLAGGGFPASHPGVVAVSSESSGRPGTYVAPGRDVPTTQPGARWALVSGSSYSAAHVSGLAALLLERSPRARRPLTLVTTQAGGAIDACATLLRGTAPCGGCGCALMMSANPAPAR